MINGRVFQAFYLQLSNEFPLLPKLSLENCIHISPNRNERKEYHKYIFEMPATFLDTLIWKGPYHGAQDINMTNLRIETPEKSYCYKGDKDGSIIESCAISFLKPWDTKNILFACIQCKDIQHFEIICKCQSCQFDFTRLRRADI
jgi:hypothetical protein